MTVERRGVALCSASGWELNMSVRDVVQAAAGVGGGDNLYVEDVFSTYIYTGNSSTQTITNGINLDEEGGMVWTKGRTTATDHYIADTERGINQGLYTNSIAASQDHTSSATVTAFNSDQSGNYRLC